MQNICVTNRIKAKDINAEALLFSILKFNNYFLNH